jgi:hypothetical protein
MTVDNAATQVGCIGPVKSAAMKDTRPVPSCVVHSHDCGPLLYMDCANSGSDAALTQNTNLLNGSTCDACAAQHSRAQRPRHKTTIALGTACSSRQRRGTPAHLRKRRAGSGACVQVRRRCHGRLRPAQRRRHGDATRADGGNTVAEHSVEKRDTVARQVAVDHEVPALRLHETPARRPTRGTGHQCWHVTHTAQ